MITGMNLLNTTHNLFASEDAFITRLWATSSLVIDGPTSASVMLVAAELADRSPWFMVKSTIVKFVRNLESTPMERETHANPLVFCDSANTVQFCVDKIVYEITFNTASLYWCFKYFATSRDHYDRRRGCGLDDQCLMEAFSEFSIPGELPSGIRGRTALQSRNANHARAQLPVSKVNCAVEARPQPATIGTENNTDIDQGKNVTHANAQAARRYSRDSVELLYQDHVNGGMDDENTNITLVDQDENDGDVTDVIHANRFTSESSRDSDLEMMSVDTSEVKAEEVVEEYDPQAPHCIPEASSAVGCILSQSPPPLALDSDAPTTDFLIGSRSAHSPPPPPFPTRVFGFLTRFGVDFQRASLPPQNTPHLIRQPNSASSSLIRYGSCPNPGQSSQSDNLSLPVKHMKRAILWPPSGQHPKRRRLL